MKVYSRFRLWLADLTARANLFKSGRAKALAERPIGSDTGHDGMTDTNRYGRSGPAISSATSSGRSRLPGKHKTDRHPVSAGAERLSAYRPRQVDLPEFRHRRGIRRPLPSALRRHQSDQGRAGIYRRHPARRALARLRLGRAPLSTRRTISSGSTNGPST